MKADQRHTLRTDDIDESPKFIKDLVRLFQVEGKFSYLDVVDNSKTMIIAVCIASFPNDHSNHHE